MQPTPRSTLFPYTTLFRSRRVRRHIAVERIRTLGIRQSVAAQRTLRYGPLTRSEEHTSELQSHSDLVCRLPLQKKSCGRNARVVAGKTSSAPAFAQHLPGE